MFQDGLNSPQTTAAVTSSSRSVAFGVPQDSLAEWFHKKSHLITSQDKENPVTYSHSKLPLFRPEASAKPRLADEMDLFAKTLFAAARPIKRPAGVSGLQTQEGSVSFALCYLCTNLIPNDLSRGQTSFRNRNWAWKRKTVNTSMGKNILSIVAALPAVS